MATKDRTGPLATWPNEWAAVLGGAATAAAFLAVGGVAALLSPAEGSVAGIVALFVAVAGGAWTILRLARRAPVIVGHDGVAIQSGARTQFVSFRDLERVEREQTPYGEQHHLARLVLRDGRVIRVGARLGLVGHAALDAVDRAYDALEQALARYRSTEPVAAAGQLTRGTLEADAWLEQASRVREGNFRDGALTSEDLLAIVEDPSAEPTARAAAAYALRVREGDQRPSMREPDRVRVRAAAASTAAPQVRIALEATADEASEEATVRRALLRVGDR